MAKERGRGNGQSFFGLFDFFLHFSDSLLSLARLSFSHLPDGALHKLARHARRVEEDGEVAASRGGEEVLLWVFFVNAR